MPNSTVYMPVATIAHYSSLHVHKPCVVCNMNSSSLAQNLCLVATPDGLGQPTVGKALKFYPYLICTEDHRLISFSAQPISSYTSCICIDTQLNYIYIILFDSISRDLVM